MSKLPAIQFYPGDWRKDPGVQALSFHDRGVWFEIILLMHESDERGKLLLNGKPMPEAALARLLGLDNQNLTTTLTTLLEFGVASRCEETGAIICRRMIRDENLRNIRKEAGKKGGNPVLVKQKSTTVVKQKSTPSSSTSLKMIDCDDNQSQVVQFERFWSICPRKTAKGSARKAWIKAIKLAPPETIIQAMAVYAKSTAGKDPQYIAHPATWLNSERWLDDSESQLKKRDPFPFNLSDPASKAKLEQMFLDGLHT
jgi:hypothetical protein